MRQAIRFRRRGQVVEVRDMSPRTLLLDHLRLAERATGTKEGCAEGDCGACTVALGRLRDGRVVYEPVNACILLLGQVDGADVVTVEDLAADGVLHPVQAAMVERHGSQCGFCTPGIVMSLWTLYREGVRPVTRAMVEDRLAGNLCRCTGYRPIVEAALAACEGPPADRFLAESEAIRADLERMADREDVLVGDESRFFAAPASEDALADLYARHSDATLVAGSTDVGLWINKGFFDPAKTIWLGRVAGLDRIETGPETLTIGATATHAAAHAALADLDPDLGELVRRFGSAQVRASGTVGGNIANGSPIGDLAPAFIALGATLELRRGERIRRIALEDFFLAYRRQDREPSEFVRSVTVARPASGEAFRCFKVSKRFDEDISAVMAAFTIALDGRRVASARVAYGGMAATPKRAPAAEAALVGTDLDDPASWEAAIAALDEDFQPLDDHRASAAYRRTVARNLLRKALHEIATGRTDETRLVGARPGLQAAE